MVGLSPSTKTFEYCIIIENPRLLFPTVHYYPSLTTDSDMFSILVSCAHNICWRSDAVQGIIGPLEKDEISISVFYLAWDSQ